MLNITNEQAGWLLAVLIGCIFGLALSSWLEHLREEAEAEAESELTRDSEIIRSCETCGCPFTGEALLFCSTGKRACPNAIWASPGIRATGVARAAMLPEHRAPAVRRKPLVEMTDCELFDWAVRLDAEEEAFKRAMEDCGGHGGSPGETMYENIQACDLELKRRGLGWPMGGKA